MEIGGGGGEVKVHDRGGWVNESEVVFNTHLLLYLWMHTIPVSRYGREKQKQNYIYIYIYIYM